MKYLYLPTYPYWNDPIGDSSREPRNQGKPVLHPRELTRAYL